MRVLPPALCMRSSFLFGLIGLLVACASHASAQSPQQIERFRLAQAYEQNGEPEEAGRLYEELLAANPRFEPFFDGVVRTSLALKHYDTLAVMIRARIAALGRSVPLFAMLGRAQFHAGKERDALATWDSAEVIAGSDEQALRRLSDEMLGAHAYEAALNLFARAGKSMKNDLAFASDRANLYMLLMRYKEATREYVRLLLANLLPLPFVESRLSYFTSIDDAQRAALEVVRAEAADNSSSVDLQYLLAWLLMERKAYAEAFDVYSVIDEKRGAGGQEVAQFATRALNEGALDVSFKAFDKVRRTATSDAVIAWAEFGAASVQEKLWRRDAPDSVALARTVADKYDLVTTQYPASGWADSAALRSAVVRSEILFDIDGATARLRGVIARGGRLARTGIPELMLADLFVARNQLDSAGAAALRVLRARGTGPDAEQRARFLLGQLRYYVGDFDSAATILGLCTAQANLPYTNDALGLLLMIQENHDSSNREALKLYAAAELAAHQHEYSRAIAALQDVAQRWGGQSIAEYAVLAMGTNYALAGQYLQARSAYQRLLDQFPESILRDRAQARIAALLEGPLHDPAAAIRAYELLLQNYPASILLEDARTRIRALRAQL